MNEGKLLAAIREALAGSRGPREDARTVDGILAGLRRAHAMGDGGRVLGYGVARLFGPDGRLRLAVPFANLITDYGDQFYVQRGSGVAAPAAVTGMRLGTGVTAVAKNGAGAAIVTYVAGSEKALDGGYPAAATKGAGLGWRATYQTTWGAGLATANGLAEAVVTNESPLTDVAGVAGDTVSRALLNPVVNKGANDTLVITWTHDLLGS